MSHASLWREKVQAEGLASAEMEMWKVPALQPDREVRWKVRPSFVGLGGGVGIIYTRCDWEAV